MVSFAVAQLKSGASSQPTVNNLVSYTEEVFFFILFFFIKYHEDAASWYFYFPTTVQGKTKLNNPFKIWKPHSHP